MSNSATYSGDPQASSADALRFKLGDTNMDAPLFNDAEILMLLTEAANDVDFAAVAGAETLAARFSSAVDKQVGDLKISYSQKAKQFAALATTLRRRLATTSAPPFCGGISKAGKAARAGDTDRVQPYFRRDLHSIPDSPPYDDPTGV